MIKFADYGIDSVTYTPDSTVIAPNLNNLVFIKGFLDSMNLLEKKFSLPTESTENMLINTRFDFNKLSRRQL
jgi:hypothetical protein